MESLRACAQGFCPLQLQIYPIGGKRALLACNLPLRAVTLATVVALLRGRVLPCEKRAVLYIGNSSGSRTENTPQVTRSSEGRQKSKAVVVQSLLLPHPYLILS